MARAVVAGTESDGVLSVMASCLLPRKALRHPGLQRCVKSGRLENIDLRSRRALGALRCLVTCVNNVHSQTGSMNEGKDVWGPKGNIKYV